MEGECEFGVGVVGGEMGRESDGVARSERHLLLQTENREKAAVI